MRGSTVYGAEVRNGYYLMVFIETPKDLELMHKFF